MRSDQHPTIHLKDYTPPSHWVDHVDIVFELDPDLTRVRSVMNVRPNTESQDTHQLVLDGDRDMQLDAVLIDGTPVNPQAMTHTESELTLFEIPGGPFKLEIHTSINPDGNTQLSGLYRSNGVFCTQCEAQGFRRITFYPDRPDVMATFSVRLEADKAQYPVLLCNGNPKETGDLEQDRHYAVWHDPHPKPSYLFALIGGDLAVIRDSFMTCEGNHVALSIFVEHGKEDQADYAMDALKRSMLWDEEVFGCIYDLDVFNIVAVSDFNLGAMENKGLNIFNDKYILADAKTATDDDYAGIEAVVAHEYFHNWTGNRVTCRDWFQLCLKEGLTVFRDQEFSSDMRDRNVKRISDVRGLWTHQYPEDAGPLAHPVRPHTYKEINNFYTSTVYNKGAEVVRMMQTWLGRETFIAANKRYLKDNDGRAATVEDYIAAMEAESGEDLSRFMRWYEQAGTPNLFMEQRYDADKRSMTLMFSQTTYATPERAKKDPFPIPIKLGFVQENGETLNWTQHERKANGGELRDDVYLLKGNLGSVIVRDVPMRCIASFLDGFSAPVKALPNISMDDKILMSQNNPDPFSRWYAAQSIIMSTILGQVRPKDGDNDTTQDVIDLVRSFVCDTNLTPAFIAQAIDLPSITAVTRELERDVVPEHVHEVIKSIKSRVADELYDDIQNRLKTIETTEPFVSNAEDSGKRSLKSALMMLAAYASDNHAVIAHARKLYQSASNMTERMAALRVIAVHDDAQRDATLQDFHDKHCIGQPLVYDKWLGLQATLPSADTLSRVQTLRNDPGFTVTNPNRVRALYGMFIAGNPVSFHAADGAGYAFLRDIILEIDPINPQLAARLLAALRSWRSVEPIRQGKLEHELKAIRNAPRLSRDLEDIIERILT